MQCSYIVKYFFISNLHEKEIRKMLKDEGNFASCLELVSNIPKMQCSLSTIEKK